MQISVAGLREIEASEGFSSKPYLDRIAEPDVWTIGYGETYNVGPNTKPITREEGERRLKARFMKAYAPALHPFENLPGFTQNMYDALSSFIWNCGTGAVSTSTKVGRALRARQWRNAADLLLEWSNAGGKRIPGLYYRRQRERSLFLKPGPSVAVRPIRLGPKEKENVDILRRKRRIANRNGGWDEIDESHNVEAEKAKKWLRDHATALSEEKVEDVDYQDRKVKFLRDVALNRNGLGV